jgi:hypothetical protein
VQGLLVGGIIGLVFLGTFSVSTKMPDQRDANLIGYVLKAISEITQDQVDYRAVSTETVRGLMHEKAPWTREHTSVPGVIRHRHGGAIEIIPIEENRRLRLRLTALPESGCIDALWSEPLWRHTLPPRDRASELPMMVRTPTPLLPRGAIGLHLRAEQPFGGSWILTVEEKERLTVGQVLAICSSSKSFSVEADFRERMAVVTKAPWD